MKKQKRLTTGRRLLSYIKPYWRQFLGGLVAMLFIALINLLYPRIIGVEVIDRVLTVKKSQSLLNLIVLGFVIIIFLKQVAAFLQNYTMAFIGQRIVANLRARIFQHLQQMSIGYHESRRTGETIARVINDIALIQNSVSIGLIDMIFQFVLLIGIIGATFYLHWKLALLTFTIFPLVALVVTKVGQRIRTVSHSMQEKIADLASILQETITGIRIVKAFTMEKHEERRFISKNEASFQASMKSARATAILTPLVELLFLSAFVLVLWYGGTEVLRGRLTLGELITFFGYIAMATAPLTGVTHHFSVFQQAFAAADRVFEVLDLDLEIKDKPNAVRLPKIAGEVEFRDVSFGYYGGENVLSHIDLHVRPGEIVALVGPSGAGKTSLVNLIPRFYDPTGGKILVDGYDLRDVQAASLREQVGLVPQETILFGVSIKDNIAYGRPGASDEEIIAAARAANAHDFIMKFAEGYDTLVGERGASLSGGQRQRIAIARALLRDPRILILDEATSALDMESERLVQEALERLMKGRTTFVIAHRLSTIQFAHKIVVLNEGKIVEKGTHEELLAKGGLYRRLYDNGLMTASSPDEGKGGFN